MVKIRKQTDIKDVYGMLGQDLYDMKNHSINQSISNTPRRKELTITVVTMALTSPLCAIVSSVNLFSMLSMNFNLPFSARTTVAK